jgi:hypothetical protein
MKDRINSLLEGLKNNTITFKEVLEFIDADITHAARAFKNGEAFNEATQNQGSAKVFTFAQKHNMSAADTLYLFAEHYQAVLATPEAVDHQNIRQFMIHGWQGIQFVA